MALHVIYRGGFLDGLQAIEGMSCIYPLFIMSVILTGHYKHRDIFFTSTLFSPEIEIVT